MAESGNHYSLALKPFEEVGVIFVLIAQDLDGDFFVQPQVSPQIDLRHTPARQQSVDMNSTQGPADPIVHDLHYTNGAPLDYEDKTAV